MRCSQIGKAVDFESTKSWFESTHFNLMTLSSVVEQSAVNRYVTSSNLVESVCTNLAQLGERRFYKPSVVGSSPTVRIAQQTRVHAC